MCCKAFETNFDRNSLHASEHQCSPPFDLFFTFVFFSVIAVYVKVLMSECLHFSLTTGYTIL